MSPAKEKANLLKTAKTIFKLYRRIVDNGHREGTLDSSKTLPIAFDDLTNWNKSVCLDIAAWHLRRMRNRSNGKAKR